MKWFHGLVMRWRVEAASTLLAWADSIQPRPSRGTAGGNVTVLDSSLGASTSHEGSTTLGTSPSTGDGSKPQLLSVTLSVPLASSTSSTWNGTTFYQGAWWCTGTDGSLADYVSDKGMWAWLPPPRASSTVRLVTTNERGTRSKKRGRKSGKPRKGSSPNARG